MSERTITVKEMASGRGVKPKAFRDALRKAKFAWHIHGHSWDVLEGSPEYRQMVQVLATIGGS